MENTNFDQSDESGGVTKLKYHCKSMCIVNQTISAHQVPWLASLSRYATVYKC